jgi:Lon protease-like protein
MSGLRIPLFPLQVVLLPGSLLPLHIFEERYRVLVAECRAQGMHFGINLARGGQVAAVGCTARLTRVVQEYADGRLDIVVEGVRRYRLLDRPDSPHPYDIGDVVFLEDEPQPVDTALLRSAVGLYNRLVEVVYRGKVPGIGEEESGELAFRMAQKAGLDLEGRQRLLETDSENARLRMLQEYLGGVVPRLERLEEVERIIRGDGYLVQPPS